MGPSGKIHLRGGPCRNGLHNVTDGNMDGDAEEAEEEAQEGSGDGTTTACILAQALCNQLNDFADEAYTTHHVMHVLEKFKNDVVEMLENNSEDIQDVDIVEVGMK